MAKIRTWLTVNEAEVEIKRLEHARDMSEAQSTAMREALEGYACDESACTKMKDGSCPRVSVGSLCGQTANYALSTDAGRKVLDVVEAAQKLSAAINNPARSDATPEFDALDEALAAMGK